MKKGMIMKRIYLFLFSISFLAQAHDMRLNIIEQAGGDNATVYIHCHGLGGNQNQAFHYCKNNPHKNENEWIINYPLVIFDFPDVRHNGQNYEEGYNKKKVTLAQNSDLDCLVSAYEQAIKKFPNCCVVGHGVSRGGAVWLNCDLDKFKNLRALIIESPFDDPISVLKNMVWFVPGADYLTKNLGVKFLKMLFPSWDEYGMKPIDIVDQIPTTISLLFVHSKQDSLIHHDSSQKLCQKLADSGHEVYCLILPSGGEHATVIYGKEGHIYNNVAQAFYKKCNLAHQPECALEGAEILEKCRVFKKANEAS